MDIGDKEWKEWRKTLITATDASVILGKNPYKTSYQLWRQKKGLDPEEEVNMAMKRGMKEEPRAREWYNEKYRAHMTPIVCQSTSFPWMGATLDGYDPHTKKILEIKTNGKEKHFNACVLGEIPEFHWIQMQHQMAVRNIETADYLSWDGETGEVIEVKRDPQFIQTMIEMEKEWYEKYLVGEETPPMNEKDYAWMEDPHFDFLCEKITENKKTIGDLEKENEKLIQDLIDHCKNQSSQNSRFKLSKIERKGSVNYSSIPELFGVDLEPYRKESSWYWRVS